MEEKGILFDISHYMLEDGPGIRTNIFVKGCSLRCKWCSNVYGLEQKIQVSYDRERCIGCGACVSVCPFKALSQAEPGEKADMDFSVCKDCLKCVTVCPVRAHTCIGKVYSVSEVINEIEKDRMFYRRSHGGVTLSGGEILMQPEFVLNILKRSWNRGIDTAIETSAFGNWNDLSNMICYCNTVFIDCKCMDAKRHKQLTGADNARILEHIRLASEQCEKQGVSLIIRLPLIPTFNDDKENIIATAEFVKSLKGSPLLNILPYHNYGAGKYEYVGKEYLLSDLNIQTKNELDRVREMLSKQNIRYSIGGYNI